MTKNLLKCFTLVTILISSVVFAENTVAKYKIRWVLAHEPAKFFEKAAKNFADKIKKESNGEIDVLVQTSTQFSGKQLLPHEVYQKLQNGELEMTQTYTTYLGKHDKELWILDLPFLFKSHEHAAKVLDGEIGQQLLKGLQAKNMQGLAFTYSGGYRILPSKGKEIHSVEDFKGLTVRVANTPVAIKTLEVLGAKPVITKDLEKARNYIMDKDTVATESTYPRYEQLGEAQGAKVINETNHSLFLTAMLINKKYFDSLPEKYQLLIRKASQEAALEERIASITEGAQIKAHAKEKGYKIVTMSPEETTRLKQATSVVYDQMGAELGADLIHKIQAMGNEK